MKLDLLLFYDQAIIYDDVSLMKFTLDSKTRGRARKGFRRDGEEPEDQTASYFWLRAMTETENFGKTITYLPKSKIAKTSWQLKKLKNTALHSIPGHRKHTAYYVRTQKDSKQIMTHASLKQL